MITLAVGNENAASLQISWIVLLVEPHTGLFTSADVLRCVENIGKVTGHSAPVDQAQASLLYHSPSAHSVANHFNDEQTDLVVQLWEFEFFAVSHVWSVVLVGKLQAFGCIKTVEVDARVKGLQILFVVGFGVELKDFYVQATDVLYVYPK